jgi:ribosomal protein S18 acetylase RimI-like enzyme
MTSDRVTIRMASPDDAARLVAIRSGAVEHDLDSDEFVHHLGIPSGDDYFCLAALVDGEVVGYLSAGGSRDDDHKSYGEFYELAVDPGFADLPVLAALVETGWSMLVDARYGGVIAWVDEDAEETHATVVGLGLTPDEREREHREHQLRLGRNIPSPARTER